jgi:2-deoxy-D-gluconate 3-dehydrogenase
MTANPFDLTGKLAVATGAKRGIGKAMAEALASAASDYVSGVVLPVDGGWLGR